MRVGRLEFVDRTLQKLGVLKAVSELTLGSGTNILASNSTDGATATSIPFSEGSNANGRWMRVGATLQCWHTITLPFASVAAVAATWTYPTAFKSATIPKVFVTIEDNMASATPSIQQVSAAYANEGGVTNTQAGLAITRMNGQTNFVSGDTVKVVVHALGEAP